MTQVLVICKNNKHLNHLAWGDYSSALSFIAPWWPADAAC